MGSNVPARLSYMHVAVGQDRAQAQIQSLMYCKFPFTHQFGRMTLTSHKAYINNYCCTRRSMGNVQQQHNVQTEGRVQSSVWRLRPRMYHKVQSSIWQDR